jgi:hypothetical protein
VKKHGVLLFFLCLPLVGDAAKPKEKPLKTSAYRKYFWGARQAFERREFEKASQLFATYRSMGSPRDKLVQQAGCEGKDEVKEFAALLKQTQSCIKGKQAKDVWWQDFESAKRQISHAFERNTPDALLPFVGCAPVDLTFQSEGFCPESGYTTVESLAKLVDYVHDRPAVYRRFMWRDRIVQPSDEVSPRWVLTTTSDQWKPRGLPNAFLMTLRQDKKGRIRIAGFAASLD